MTQVTERFMVLLVCLLSTLVCCDDASSVPEPATATGTSDAATPASSDSAVSAPIYSPIPCGSAICTEFKLPPVPPCCFDAAQSTCGKQSSTGRCVVPPPRDPRCPTVGDGYGCCTATGMCGADVSVFGFGCEELGDETFRKFNPSAPPPRRCDGAPLPDAGADPDAGN